MKARDPHTLVYVDENGCWIWTAAMCNGHPCYGRTQEGKQTKFYVRRVFWEEVNGPIPEGKAIGRCEDDYRCVNPDHSHLTTQADAARKGQKRRWATQR